MNNILTLPSPSPSASSPSGGGGGTVPIVVSFSTGNGFGTAPDPTIFSALKNVTDNSGNNAIWLKLPPNTIGAVSNCKVRRLTNNWSNGGVQYPIVPDIRNPGQVDNEIPLKVEFQVANNSQGGGSVTVISGPSTATFPGTEGSVQTICQYPIAK